MDNFFILVIGFLFALMAGFLIFYFQTQQSLKEIKAKIEEFHVPSAVSRTASEVRRECAINHDVLVLLEADISRSKRESLTEEELQSFDTARVKIKACIAELKASGEWIGLPFDLDWREMLDRLPNVLALYRKAEADKQALELSPDKGARPPGDSPMP